MTRVVAALLLLLFSAGVVAEACGPGASTPAPTPTLTVADPSFQPRTPSPTIEVPPPID